VATTAFAVPRRAFRPPSTVDGRVLVIRHR